MSRRKDCRTVRHSQQSGTSARILVTAIQTPNKHVKTGAFGVPLSNPELRSTSRGGGWHVVRPWLLQRSAIALAAVGRAIHVPEYVALLQCRYSRDGC